MKYPRLPGLTLDGQVYQNEEMGTVEAIIPPGPWRTCHGPGMVELPNGDLLCCWFAGTFEGDADVHIVCARLPKGADKWEEPVDVSNDPTRSEQNPLSVPGPRRRRMVHVYRPAGPGCQERTICSLPLRSAARNPLTAARPGPTTKPFSLRRAPSPGSPSRS